MLEHIHLYNGKKILVTGDTGFKGSWLSLWLVELGAKVTGYALEPYTQNDNFLLAKLEDKIEHYHGDVRNHNRLKKIINVVQPDIIFHLAAQPLVRKSYEIPKETFEVNFNGTLNLMDSIRKEECVKGVVIITTDKCYENMEQIWGYREYDSLGGYDPYSASKSCAELLVSSYRDAFFNVEDYEKHGKIICTARAGNVIGGGDWQKDRIVPDCIRALLEEKPIDLRNPGSIRPFQHVLEPLGGYLQLGAEILRGNTEISGAWNFGPDDNSIINVRRLAKLIQKCWGSGEIREPMQGIRSNLHETKILKLDCTKAKVLLRWKPVLDIEECISMTVEWYKEYKNSHVYEICKNQIAQYMSKIICEEIR